MASFFASLPFVPHPIATRSNNYLILPSSQTPNPQASNSNDNNNVNQPPQSLENPAALSSSNSEQPQIIRPINMKKATADSTDWIASGLTRRFGIGAGLAWVGFLAVGVVSEQIKTRLEVSQQEAGTRDVEKEEEVILPNGIRYYELRVGGGAYPRPGDLVVINVKGSVQGDRVFVDTFGNKPLALVLGSRPYSKGICEGVEYVLRNMKAGGKRQVVVPPSLGFGEEGAEFGEGLEIPRLATLEYVIEVEKVSIAPA
ncbi:Peptidyl-prolyl cis-trans isomerase FKBP17-2-chloroplastic [Striga hermonthica]|uniref:peptidylprolyl isomerase n=1 Tax=Striga hermonthica TaxID=68872 RepID=A0A9N7NAJ4_STRHE|nr:Peptidyl-prolyl cis-trans isomerase FKBP17-2-chloroplastic [Striga hermonthica]